MSIDLNNLNSMLDKALDKETTDSLNEWIGKKENLFTLTAEEVELVERNLIYFFKSDKEKVDNLLIRIKQWKEA